MVSPHVPPPCAGVMRATRHTCGATSVRELPPKLRFSLSCIADRCDADGLSPARYPAIRVMAGDQCLSINPLGTFFMHASHPPKSVRRHARESVTHLATETARVLQACRRHRWRQGGMEIG